MVVNKSIWSFKHFKSPDVAPLTGLPSGRLVALSLLMCLFINLPFDYFAAVGYSISPRVCLLTVCRSDLLYFHRAFVYHRIFFFFKKNPTTTSRRYFVLNSLRIPILLNKTRYMFLLLQKKKSVKHFHIRELPVMNDVMNGKSRRLTDDWNSCRWWCVVPKLFHFQRLTIRETSPRKGN